MTTEYPQGDEPLIPMPALSLPALRQPVALSACLRSWPAMMIVPFLLPGFAACHPSGRGPPRRPARALTGRFAVNDAMEV